MAAAGLQGIWGLEQLDRTGLSTWKIWLLLQGSFAFVISLLFLIYGDQPAWPKDVNPIPPGIIFVVWMFMGVIDALYLTLVFAITRNIQRFTESAFPGDDTVISLRSELRPGVKVICTVLILVFAILFLVFAPEFTRAFGLYFYNLVNIWGTAHTVVFYALIVSMFFATALLIIAFISAGKYLAAVARRIQLDILEPDRYACLCNLGVVILICESFFLAIVGALMLLISLPAFTNFLVSITLFGLILIMLPCFIHAIRPVWILHKRLVQAKAAERRKVKRQIDALSPDDTVENPFGRTTLLNYYMLVDTLPEWPLGPHLHKLIFYILLPPLTWALAAALDQALF